MDQLCCVSNRSPISVNHLAAFSQVALRSIFGPLCLVSVLWLSMSPATATELSALKHVENAELVGKARLKVMLWKVFDAELYAPNGQYGKQQPFALSLTYLRNLKGAKIVESTISELRAQGMQDESALTDWAKQLQDIFPDVGKGSNITGVRDAEGHTLFYCDNLACGSVSNPDFTNRFFDIWLGEATSKPAFRKKLLNET